MAKKLVKLERWLIQWGLSFRSIDPKEGEEGAYELFNQATGEVRARLHQLKGKSMVFWKGCWEGAGDGGQRSFVAAAEEVMYCFGFAHGHIGNLQRSGSEW